MKTFICGCSEVKPCADHANQSEPVGDSYHILGCSECRSISGHSASCSRYQQWRDVDALLQSGVKVPTLRSCILRHPGCEGVSAGSHGAAGGFCSVFCPSCRLVEDGAVLASLRNQGRVMDEVLALAPTPLLTQEVQ